ncbi:Lon protease family protein [Psychrobacter sp. I-STPA6b]|uniref:Lon protease family protein n=1 Tax=Psychrobacter sp. I-STPA6b TaxID=2585718 RepID=UPI001D0C08D1|nr:ATP-binding protein [Psychrobacter sp. I-STPA6b]
MQKSLSYKTVKQIKTACQLSASQVKCYTDPNTLPKTTNEVAVSNNADFLGIGQQRALTAIETALGIPASGYHIFATGESGLGKRTLILKKLQEHAQSQRTADDWVYVYNFVAPRSPIALSLPAGLASFLAQNIQQLWETAKKQLTQHFNSPHYLQQLDIIKQSTATQSNDKKSKKKKSHSTSNTTIAHSAQPKYLKTDFAQLVETLTLEDKAIAHIECLQQALASHTITPLFKTFKQQLTEYWHKTTLTDAVSKPIQSAQLDALLTHLQNIENDMITHIIQIVKDASEFCCHGMQTVPSRYDFHIIAQHTPASGAPIVFEDMPTHLNLLGHIEQLTQNGSINSDVSMIQAGALHRANGGYLILEASHLLEQPYAWQGLKRALQSGRIKLSSLEQMLVHSDSLSLTPASIPLNVKVILLGEPDLYEQLLELEPDFNAIFKVRADFHDEVLRNKDSIYAMIGKITDMILADNLLPFDNTALASLIDHLSLQAESQHKLSLHSDRLAQILHESNRHARLNDCTIVSASHVQQSIVDITQRSGYLKDLYWQELIDGQQLISTRGKAVGQINALTIINYADSEFGLPARLTAVVQHSIGTGDILDIERDVELGGSLHAKGMLIMNSYLRALFSPFHTLNFTASMAFEQSYAHIDGDSATLAEACALLSALADTPIHQSYAITGSMNQLGEVQAVGGINDKIIGFYDACIEQGLTGQQGVIIPSANISQLMLRDDIVKAVASGQFHIYAVRTLSEALTILTDLNIDRMNKKQRYHKSTLFGRILKRLEMWEMDKEQEEDDNIEKTEKDNG